METKIEKILMVVSARPNYMKAYPLYLELKDKYSITFIHTGQHIDDNMNKAFMDILQLPTPYKQYKLVNKCGKAGVYDDILYNNAGPSEYLYNIADKLNDIDCDKLGQIGEIKKYLVNDITEIGPDYVMVFGDVTGTLASALAAKSKGVRLIHVESGLRSFDLTMPEEVNRIIVDHVSDILLVTQKSGYKNLRDEKVKGNVYYIGNPMIDCLKLFENKAKSINLYKKYNLEKKMYILVTIHRPSNVDDPNMLRKICEELNNLGTRYSIVFPVHPRTKKNIDNYSIVCSNLILIDPLDYISFISLMMDSFAVITDSGGIQEETTYLDIPCCTYRENTERPDTLVCNGGTNRLVRSITYDMFDK